MWNVGGGELLVIALVALIALGPEQLPTVMRKLGALTKQVRSLSTGLRDEFLSGLEDAQGSGSTGTKPRSAVPFDPSEPVVPRGFAQQQAAERAREQAELARELAASPDPHPIERATDAPFGHEAGGSATGATDTTAPTGTGTGSGDAPGTDAAPGDQPAPPVAPPVPAPGRPATAPGPRRTPPPTHRANGRQPDEGAVAGRDHVS